MILLIVALIVNKKTHLPIDECNNQIAAEIQDIPLYRCFAESPPRWAWVRIDGKFVTESKRCLRMGGGPRTYATP